MLLKELQALSAKYGIYPRKSLGQNFLINPEILSLLSSYSKNKNVFEIGPGFGFLTKELLKTSKHLTAIELDSKITTLLKLELQDNKNLTLLEGDFLSLNLSNYPIDIIISAPPYFISKEIIKKLVFSDIKEAVLLMQREFLEKLTDIEGGMDYKAISVFFQSFYNAKLLKQVGKNSFYPSPSIDSAVIHLKSKTKTLPLNQRQEYFKFLTLLFRHRNKTIRNSLLLEKFPSLADKKPYKNEKVMALPVATFISLFTELQKSKK